VTRATCVLAATALVLGVAVEPVGREPGWIPDLITGWALAAAGVLAARSRRERLVGPLLAAAGVLWFVGNLAGSGVAVLAWAGTHLALAYRVPLIVAIAIPLRSRLITAAACAAAATPAVANSAAGALAAATLILLAGGRAAAVLAAAIAGAAAVAHVLAPGEASLALTTSFDACVVVAALLTTAGPQIELPDALVAAAGDPAAAFRDALSKVLGDPLLSVDFLTGPVAAPPGRELTTIVDGSAVVAALVHRVGALQDPVLHEAVTGATRLQAANLALQRELQAQGDALAASGRRLLAAADEQRHRLERRVRAGPVARLEALERRLATTDGLDDARRNLAVSLEELRTLAAGLYPGVADGTPLVAALTALAARSPVPTRVEAKALPEIPATVRSALLFTCGEALANVVKHAAATRAEIHVRAVDAAIELTIADDGRGGADPAAGSGLRGLQDRLGLLGGTLSATAGDDGGTRVAACLPLGDAR
jgi:signal transduction histidine kinase